MDSYSYSKYIATTDTMKDVLEEFGVAIIPNVLNEEECINMQAGMWDTLEYMTNKWIVPIIKDNSVSWRGLRQLYPKHGMLIQNWSIGHSQFIWDVRQNPKIVNVFAKLWNVTQDKLLVSFDGASFSMPPEKTNIGWYRETKYHTDQSPLNKDFDCIQGWVNGFDTNKGDATLAFLEGSHKYHHKLNEKFGIDVKDDWYRLDDKEQTQYFINEGCIEKRISCPKGSLVLWDSRTFHTGSEPIKGRAEPNFRCCVYVCYKPRSQASQSTLTKRKKAFEEMRMTCHNPIKSLLFPKNPRTYGGPIPDLFELPNPILNDLGKKLVGY
jgi:ectoine hydroxylase-related dioxygenase (phytanoyl-CoA dioxygenase family)